MTISDQGIAFINSFEGFKAKPYPDPATGGEPITIGYGTTHYPDGRKVTMYDPPITQDMAVSYLKHYVDTLLSPWLTTHLPQENQCQFDALASFCYNLGLGSLQKSTLLKDIEAHFDCSKITTDFEAWSSANHHIMPGLLKRRHKEALLYCNCSYT